MDLGRRHQLHRADRLLSGKPPELLLRDGTRRSTPRVFIHHHLRQDRSCGYVLFPVHPHHLRQKRHLHHRLRHHVFPVRLYHGLLLEYHLARFRRVAAAGGGGRVRAASPRQVQALHHLAGAFDPRELLHRLVHLRGGTPACSRLFHRRAQGLEEADQRLLQDGGLFHCGDHDDRRIDPARVFRVGTRLFLVELLPRKIRRQYRLHSRFRGRAGGHLQDDLQLRRLCPAYRKRRPPECLHRHHHDLPRDPVPFLLKDQAPRATCLRIPAAVLFDQLCHPSARLYLARLPLPEYAPLPLLVLVVVFADLYGISGVHVSGLCQARLRDRRRRRLPDLSLSRRHLQQG